MSGTIFDDFGPTAEYKIEIKLFLYGRGGSNDFINVDDVIVTLAEPAN